MIKALIVEDNPVFRRILDQIISSKFPSMRVAEAADGEEALRMVESFLPDLIFMDIRLPGENGLELTKKIKAAYPHVVVVMLTSYDLCEYRKAAARCGANYFLTKGATSGEEIVALIASIGSERAGRPNA